MTDYMTWFLVTYLLCALVFLGQEIRMIGFELEAEGYKELLEIREGIEQRRQERESEEAMKLIEFSEYDGQPYLDEQQMDEAYAEFDREVKDLQDRIDAAHRCGDLALADQLEDELTELFEANK